MAWVRSEYAGELAVVSAWVSALMPWSITVLAPEDSELLFIILRYAYFHFQFLENLALSTEPFLWIHEAHDFVAPGVEPAIATAGLGAAVFSLALALSVVYYVAEERVEALPVDPVRVMGALLGVATLVYGVAFVLLWQNKAGWTVPVSPLFMALFAVVLLRIDRTDG